MTQAEFREFFEAKGCTVERYGPNLVAHKPGKEGYVQMTDGLGFMSVMGRTDGGWGVASSLSAAYRRAFATTAIPINGND